MKSYAVRASEEEIKEKKQLLVNIRCGFLDRVILLELPLSTVSHLRKAFFHNKQPVLCKEWVKMKSAQTQGRRTGNIKKKVLLVSDLFLWMESLCLICFQW